MREKINGSTQFILSESEQDLDDGCDPRKGTSKRKRVSTKPILIPPIQCRMQQFWMNLHTDKAASMVFVNIKQEDRDNLALTELGNLRLWAIEKPETKFVLFFITRNEEKYENCIMLL